MSRLRDAERIDTLILERDVAREECGHEKAMRKHISGEMSGWIKRTLKTEAELRAAKEVVEAAMDRKHYSDNPRTTLHSWSENEPLTAIGGTCGLCTAISNYKAAKE